MKKLKNLSIYLFFVILLSASLFSCKDDPETPKAIVTVLSTDSLPVYDAKVRIWVKDANNTDIREEYNGDVPRATDVYGQIHYNFRYEGIVDISVEKKDGSVSRSGKGVLILKEDRTYEETIIIK